MKIGMIIDSINSQMAGIDYYAKGIAENLQAYAPYHKYEAINYRKRCPDNKTGLHILSFFPFGKTIIWYNYLPFALKRKKYDFIFNLNAIPHLIPFVQKEVFFVHDLNPIKSPAFHTKRRYLIFKMLLKNTIMRAQKLVTNSIDTKNKLLDNFNIPKDKIHVLYLPNKQIPPKKITLPLDQPYILNVNTFEPRKNLINLINAFEYLKKKFHIPHALILVGGLGWKYKEILNKINKSPYNEHIVLTGYLEDAKKNYLYTHADLFVYPSFEEGLGIPILEAMVHKCPVVCSDIPMLREHLGRHAIIINPSNYTTIAQGINTLIRSKTLKKRLITDGYQKSLHIFNSDIIKQKITAFETFLST